MKRTLKRQKIPPPPPENIIFDFFFLFSFFLFFIFYLQFLANYDNDYMTIQDLINFTGQNDKIF